MKQDNKLTKIETPIIKDEATALIAQAIDKGVSVETMEKLLAMRKELRAEKAKEEFDKALSAFQGECPIIEKKKKVAFNTTHYSYAPLEDIVEQVKPLLAKNGFSYMFDTKTNGKMQVICKVKHLAGHMETSTFDMEIDQNAKMNVSQKYGSALTYAKRYAFCAAFGINVKDEDTDVSQAPEVQTPAKPQQSPVNAPTRPSVAQSNGVSKPNQEHFCTIHNKPMKERRGQNSLYWDHRWTNEAGQWQKCNGIVKAKPQAGDELTDSQMEAIAGDPTEEIPLPSEN